MNHPSIGRGIPHSLSIAVGLTFSVAGLILALSSVVYAEGTQLRHDTTTSKAEGTQTTGPETSAGRGYGTQEGDLHKSGVMKKNPQRSNIRHEPDQQDGTGSFTNRDPGNQRKIRRGLA
ncbi:MAG TPA: hypothetical protein VF780_08825 [Nitrosospira sp.]